jgi:hypothetical protein
MSLKAGGVALNLTAARWVVGVKWMHAHAWDACLRAVVYAWLGTFACLCSSSSSSSSSRQTVWSACLDDTRPHRLVVVCRHVSALPPAARTHAHTHTRTHTRTHTPRRSHVMLMDPWWNPAVEQQAQDRIHRLGQVSGAAVLAGRGVVTVRAR